MRKFVSSGDVVEDSVVEETRDDVELVEFDDGLD
jgi:hypothetical protein